MTWPFLWLGKKNQVYFRVLYPGLQFLSFDKLVSIFRDLSEDSILLTFVIAFFILCLFGEMEEKDPVGEGERKEIWDLNSLRKSNAYRLLLGKKGVVNSCEKWYFYYITTRERGTSHPPKKTAGLMLLCLFSISGQNLFFCTTEPVSLFSPFGRKAFKIASRLHLLDPY